MILQGAAIDGSGGYLVGSKTCEADFLIYTQPFSFVHCPSRKRVYAWEV